MAIHAKQANTLHRAVMVDENLVDTGDCKWRSTFRRTDLMSVSDFEVRGDDGILVASGGSHDMGPRDE